MDGCEIHFAPPEKPWNDDFPPHTRKVWFQSGAGFRPSTVYTVDGVAKSRNLTTVNETRVKKPQGWVVFTLGHHIIALGV